MPSYFDYEELAALILAKGNEEKAEEILEQESSVAPMWEDHEIDFEQFCKIVDMLMDFTFPLESPLTKTLYKGFVHNNRFVIKKEVE